MPVTLAQTGQYIGYTQATKSQTPTLYFEKGRITQVHSNPANVGWHPLRYTHWYRGNFDLTGDNPVTVQTNIRFEVDAVAFDVDPIDVVDRNGHPYHRKRNNTRLLEGVYDAENNRLRVLHRSRSHLRFPGGNNGFDGDTYGEAYAQDAREQANLAANER
ncbi:MAG: hypothetical protein AAF617_04950 [Bacteroidota bacterium]